MQIGLHSSMIKVSVGEDSDTFGMQIAPLLASGWQLDTDGMGLEARLQFPTFIKAAVSALSLLLMVYLILP